MDFPILFMDLGVEEGPRNWPERKMFREENGKITRRPGLVQHTFNYN